MTTFGTFIFLSMLYRLPEYCITLNMPLDDTLMMCPLHCVTVLVVAGCKVEVEDAQTAKPQILLSAFFLTLHIKLRANCCMITSVCGRTVWTTSTSTSTNIYIWLLDKTIKYCYFKEIQFTI